MQRAISSSRAGAVAEATGDVVQDGKLVGQAGDDAAEAPAALQGGEDLQQLAGVQGGGDAGALHQGAQVVDAAQGEAGLQVQQAAGLGGGLLAAQHHVRVGGGRQGQGQLAPGREGGVGGQAGQDLGEFQGLQGLGQHGNLVVRRIGGIVA